MEDKETEISFASILRNSMYLNRDVLFALRPPTGFVHRIKQKNELIMELSPILTKSAVSGIFVYGNPGTGKTALVQELADQLEKEAKKEGIALKTVYVNCSENRTETSILISVLSALNKKKNIPKLGWTRSKAIDEFEKEVERYEHTLLILDEVDYALKESDVIVYRLSRTNDKVKAKVSTVIISNDIRVQEYIKPRTQSKFGRIKIIFGPYRADELKDIIKQRTKFALKPNVISDAVIQKIAEIESERGGDVRHALELVDNCAKIAIARKKEKITLDLVQEADKSLEENDVLNRVISLPKHQKIVYLAILKNKDFTIDSGQVYKNYREICAAANIESLTERRIRTLLINLSEIGLILAEVGWLKSLKKKTRKITLNLDKALKIKVEKMLKKSI